MKSSRINTLVLYGRDTDKISYYDDWMEAFTRSVQLETRCMNIYDRANITKLDKTIKEFELIVLLHSINRTLDAIKNFKSYMNIIHRRRGILLSMVGDEFNQPDAPLQYKLDFLKEIVPDYIGTQLPLGAGKWLYEECNNATVIALPHALNEHMFRPLTHNSQRRIDIGAICIKYPPYLGDNDRDSILNYFHSNPKLPDLATDIRNIDNVTKRLNRQGWCNFCDKTLCCT